MKNSVKILLIALITILCGVAGYFIADVVKAPKTGGAAAGGGAIGGGAPTAVTGKTGKINTGSPTTSVTGTTATTTTTPAGSTATETAIDNEPVISKPAASGVDPVITSVSKPVYNASAKNYTFNVTADGNELTYILTYYNGTKVSSQKSGSFTVSPVKNGKYVVYVTDASGKSSEKKTVNGCVIVYEKLTASEIQTALNSGDYIQGDKLDFKNRISRNCSYTFNGLKEDEDKPSSYSEVFNRIGLSTWRSVNVTNVSYDSASNQVTRIVMTVNY